MTPEQQDAYDAAHELTFRTRKAENAAKDYQKQMAENRDQYMADSHERVKRSRATNPDKHRATAIKNGKKIIDAKKFHCSDCDHSFQRQKHLDRHLKTPMHLRNADASQKTIQKYNCELCRYHSGDKTLYTNHLNTKKHIDNVARAASEAKTSLELA